MLTSSKRAQLLDMIQRFEWLLEYYERSGASPESVRAFHVARDKAVSDLAALTQAEPPAAPQDREHQSQVSNVTN
jgi:hypothetical protein